MHTARPVGLSEDGQSLIVETGDGEKIAIPADPQLRQLLRSVRPRPQLEIEMETAMTPREIQMKIRAGASVEEIADASGMPIHRVEAFAAPVIAERNHIAGLAQAGSVRRQGEPTGHRTLRLAISDRLRERGVDPESVRWDAFKMDDGRWSVSAGYRLEQADREAVFYFDQRSRFSVAGNDEGRWAIGEQPAAPQSPEPVAATSLQEDSDTEPTLKLSGPADEMALLRAVETDDDSGASSETADSTGSAEEEAAADDSAADDSVAEVEIVEEIAIVTETVSEDDESDTAEAGADQSPMDLLYDLLGSDGYAEESTHVYEGLTDAAAVPDVADSAWTSEDDQEYPAEPEQEAQPEAEVEAHSEDSAEPEVEVEEADSKASRPKPAPSETAESEAAEVVQFKANQFKANRKSARQTDDAAQDALPGADIPLPDKSEAEQSEVGQSKAGQSEDGNTSEDTDTSEAPEPAATADSTQSVAADTSDSPADSAESGGEGAEEEAPKPAPKSKKRKRASVPSWDEIMFGSPKAK